MNMNHADCHTDNVTDLLESARRATSSARLHLFDDQVLPLVVRPLLPMANLAIWAVENADFIRDQLSRFGGLLFRGFDVEDGTFNAFISNTSSGALPYTERSSPRTNVKGNIYTSTDYPAEYPIFLHNEQSYNTAFPLKIYFMCVAPPSTMGATPIADVRKVLSRLSPELKEAFLRRRYSYVRNMGGPVGMHWADVFQTHDRAEVDAYCAKNDITTEWLDDDRLRTRQVRDVIARHPDSGELCWFNHLTFFNVATLPSDIGELLMDAVGEFDLPNHTFYGDGGMIAIDVVEELRNAYEAESVSFEWEAGDVLMLDNMLVAHGRQPFTGARRIVTGLADPCEWDAVRITLGS